MTDDPDVMTKRLAYIDTLRDMHKNKRLIGFVGCLLGVLVMLYGRFGGGPEQAVWAGLAIVVVSWLLFTYVILSRVLYVRAHPFDPGA